MDTSYLSCYLSLIETDITHTSKMSTLVNLPSSMLDTRTIASLALAFGAGILVDRLYPRTPTTKYCDGLIGVTFKITGHNVEIVGAGGLPMTEALTEAVDAFLEADINEDEDEGDPVQCQQPEPITKQQHVSARTILNSFLMAWVVIVAMLFYRAGKDVDQARWRDMYGMLVCGAIVMAAVQLLWVLFDQVFGWVKK